LSASVDQTGKNSHHSKLLNHHLIHCHFNATTAPWKYKKNQWKILFAMFNNAHKLHAKHTRCSDTATQYLKKWQRLDRLLSKQKT